MYNENSRPDVVTPHYLTLVSYSSVNSMRCHRSREYRKSKRLDVLEYFLAKRKNTSTSAFEVSLALIKLVWITFKEFYIFSLRLIVVVREIL